MKKNEKYKRGTGKSLSEALVLAASNPKYVKRLFIELLHVKYMKIASSEHAQNMLRTCCVHKLFFCFCFDIQNNLRTQLVLPLF